MQYSILITIIVGSVLSQMMPYFRKLSEGSIEKFDFKYAYNTAISAFWSSLLAIPVYTTWEVPSGITDVAIVHIMALLFGFGGYKLQTEGLKYYKLLSSVNDEFVEEVTKVASEEKVTKKKAAKKPAKKPAKKAVKKVIKKKVSKTTKATEGKE